MSSLRKILFPFSLLYGGLMLLRNKLFDRGLISSKKFQLPIIAVGNLSMGGTGKSPMVEYLVDLLWKEKKVAVLSRGYKRRTSGYLLLTGQESAAEVGDEPLQFKQKYREALVAVDESRSHGIEELLREDPAPNVVILDDAFQHRKVAAGFYILLSAYSSLYNKDLVLPAGNLREPSSGAKRADVIVITKCPEDLDEQRKEEIIHGLKPTRSQQVFFSRIAYSEIVYSRNRSLQLKELQKMTFTLVTGIANAAPLVRYLQQHGLAFEHRAFRDHHNFTEEELKQLQNEELILTTEKDYMRLKDEISREKIFYLPIKTVFLNGGEQFDALIHNFVQKK